MLPYVCTQADRLLWEFTARTLADMANADVVTQRADTSSHPSPARAGRADASVDRRGFPWLSLCDDLQQKVLGYVRLHVTERHERFRQTPAHMLPSMANYPGLLPRFSKRSRSFVMDVERVFSRTRKNILEWDRLLTVTFTESVNRDRLNPEISTADADWFCARSSTTQTWSGVSRIRTRVMQCFDSRGHLLPFAGYVFELVLEDGDGVETPVEPSRVFALNGTPEHLHFSDQVVKQLGLSHTEVKKGVFELTA